MLENDQLLSPDMPETTDDDNKRGDVVSENYQGPDRRGREPKAWYQTFWNNAGQWISIATMIGTGAFMISDFRTKTAVRDALIDERFTQYAGRDDRIESAIKEAENRRVAEKQEFTNHINAIVGEIRSDVRSIRDQLDRGRR
ncbi:MAG: hypothetical protein ACRDAM_15830 [Casimicrobium sp.]